MFYNKMENMTDIYLTIDLECRLDCADYQCPIYGRINGTSESYGLDFILETFKKYDLKATFFVEPFFSYRFGLRSLREVCDKILSQQHDIQLHMHPYFKSTKDKIFEDRLYAYNYADQLSLIREAKDILLKCGAASPVAFRAGSFAASNTTYDALDSCGIKISSSYNLNYLNQICKIGLSGQYNYPFLYKGKILEMPVTCFCEFNPLKFLPMYRHMQIGAVSFPEMRWVIEKAGSTDSKYVVILLHTFEFVNFNQRNKNGNKFDKVNISRFLSLCKFLSGNRDKIEIKKMCDIDMIQRFQRGNHNDEIPRMPIKLLALGGFERIKKRMR